MNAGWSRPLAVALVALAAALAGCSSDTTGASNAPSGGATPPPGGDGVMCTMDAKLCPDGSSVGRSGPNCEFAPCPEGSAAPAAPEGSAPPVTP